MRFVICILLGLLLMLTMSSSLFLRQQNTPVQPSLIKSQYQSPFGGNIYKIGTELKSIEKGDLSTYYQANAAGWNRAGYDALLFAFCSDCHTRTPDFISLPGNGGFDNRKGLNAFALDGLPFWLTNDTSKSTGGTFVASNATQPVYSGKASFHSNATVPGPIFGYSGITQNLTIHSWYAPLVSNILFQGQLYPEKLTGPDSVIVFRFDMSYLDQANTPTRMYFLYHNNSITSFNPNTLGLSNDTNTRIFDLTQTTPPLTPHQWNPLSWNLTKYAIDGFGDFYRGIDNRILSIAVQSWSRNGAANEFYLDSLDLKSTLDPQTSHQNEEKILMHYNMTSPIPLYSGVTDFTEIQDVIWFGTSNYPIFPANTPTSQFTNAIRSGGGYPFLAAPFFFPQNTFDVNAIPVYSDAQGWAGTGSWANGFGLWDNYLKSGHFAMGYVEQHPYVRTAASFYANSGGPATFVYADSLSWQSIVEAMAQGRSFGEYGWITPRMNLYFAAQNDLVASGRFPVYVDPSTTTVSLHVRISQIPSLTTPLMLRIIENGNTADIIPLRSNAPYDQILNYPLTSSSGTDYFRYEIFSGLNPILAFSNPIIFTKTSALPTNTWVAETPGLNYGTANSFLSDLGQNSTTVNFRVNAQPGLSITTTVYSPVRPSDVNATSWSYDQANRLVTLTTSGTQGVAISYPVSAHDFTISATPTAVNLLVGETGVSTISVKITNPSMPPVSLAFTVAPTAGLTCSLSNTNAMSTPSSLSCVGSTSGNYTVTVLASTPTVLQSISVAYAVQDFSLMLAPSTIQTSSNTNAVSTIRIQPLNGFSRNITLTYAASPKEGVSCTFSRSNLQPATLDSSITCIPSSGTYSVIITANSGRLAHSIPLVISATSKSASLPTIMSLWPYILLGGVVSVLSGLVLTVARKK